MITPRDAGVTNIIATPITGPSRATVPLTSAPIAKHPQPAAAHQLGAASEAGGPAELLDHDRLQRDGSADEVDDGERDPDHGEDNRLATIVMRSVAQASGSSAGTMPR